LLLSDPLGPFVGGPLIGRGFVLVAPVLYLLNLAQSSYFAPFFVGFQYVSFGRKPNTHPFFGVIPKPSFTGSALTRLNVNQGVFNPQPSDPKIFLSIFLCFFLDQTPLVFSFSHRPTLFFIPSNLQPHFSLFGSIFPLRPHFSLLFSSVVCRHV